MATTIEYNIKVNDNEALSSIGAMEDELSRLNEEIKEVDVNSQAFADLATKIGSVETQLEGAQSGLARFTAEDKVKAFQGSIDVLGGSIAGVTGAVGLLGVESEEFDKITARAASAIAFASGLKQASDGAIALSQSLAKSAKAQKLFAVAQNLVNSGLGKFKIALAATGIGVIVIALGLLIANFDKVSAAVTKFVGKSKFLTAAVGTAKAAFDKFINAIRPALEFLGLLPDEAERAEIAQRKLAATTAETSDKELQLLKAKGAAAEEIYNKEIELINAKIAATEDETEAEDLAFQKTLLIAKEEKRLADEETKRENEAAARRKKQREEEEAAREKAAAEKKAQAEKEAAEKLAADEKAAEEKKREEEKAVADEESRLQAIAAIILQYKQKQEEIDATTRVEKLELEEERKIAELEKLNADEEEIAAIRTYYAARKKEAETQDEADAVATAQKEADDKIAAALAEKEARAAIEQAKFGILAQFGGLLAELAGESKELQIAAVVAQQAAAIGQIISATGIANAKAVAASPLTVGQPWVTINTISAGISIASAVASAVKSIAQIKATAGKGGGGGGSAAGASRVPSAAGGAGGGGAISSPLEQFTATGTSPEALASQQTVRAYVIGGDVTSNQEAEAKINSRRSLAG